MIVEERIYTLHVGKTAELVKLYETEGIPIQSRILGNFLGFFSTEIGPLNQVIHLWGYDNFEERTRRRAELLAHPDWQNFLKKIRPLIQSQENKILNPAPFSPIGARE